MKKIVLSLMLVGVLGVAMHGKKSKGVIRQSTVAILDGIFSGTK